MDDEQVQIEKNCDDLLKDTDSSTTFLNGNNNNNNNNNVDDGKLVLTIKVNQNEADDEEIVHNGSTIVHVSGEKTDVDEDEEKFDFSESDFDDEDEDLSFLQSPGPASKDKAVNLSLDIAETTELSPERARPPETEDDVLISQFFDKANDIVGAKEILFFVI